MEVFYRVEGTIWYKNSEANVQSLQACLWECFGISSDILVKDEKSTRKIGIQFSFYKKEEYEFAEEFISLLQSGMTPKDGEVIFANSHNGERQYFICGGRFVSNERYS